MSEDFGTMLVVTGLVIIIMLGIYTIHTKRAWLGGKWLSEKKAVFWGWVAIVTGSILLVHFLSTFKHLFFKS